MRAQYHTVGRWAMIFLLLFFLGIWNSQMKKSQSFESSEPANVRDFQAEQQYLSDIIKSRGPRAAYTMFQERYPTYDPLHRHYLGHFMGDRIYRALGEKGITLCDSTFEFGCVHGFIMAGVGKEGADFLRRTEKACRGMADHVSVEKCLHGLGHGILSYKGYSKDDLLAALAQCDEFSPTQPSLCYNGTFMEYNLRPMDTAQLGTFSGRAFDPSHPLNPCDELPISYQSDCYIEMGSWWSNVIPGEYQRMGAFCDDVTDERSRENCFTGVGRILTDVNHFDVEKISQECHGMPSIEGVAWCTQGAMGVMITEGERQALELCQFVDSSKKEQCMSWGKDFWCREKGVCD